MTLKEKTINGLAWSFVDSLSKQGITFIIGIILARLLSPHEFGLIGMTTIFFAISQSFISGGFGEALIRKKECSQADYSTAFYYNLFISIVFFLIIYFSAGSIGNFFNEPKLKQIIRVLDAGLIIAAFSIIQQTILTSHIDFKLQTKISIISGLISGSVGILMAFLSYGVWSLVAKMLMGSVLTSFLLWVWNKWRPSLVFSMKSFKEMFSFGNKLLLVNLIDTIYRNVYLLIIGKFYSASDLGYYSRAEQFSTLPVQNLAITVQRVSFPVMSIVQDEQARLKEGYRRILLSTMFISFFMMLGLAAVAKPLIMLLIGEKWVPAILYLQLLCFGTMLYPLHALNLNMLNVKGRSDLFLKIEIIKKAMAIPVIVIGILWGIEYMIIGMIINSFIAYYINSYYSGLLIHYTMKEQIIDILPILLPALLVSGIVYSFTYILKINNLLMLIIQVFVGVVLTIALSEWLKLKGYLEIKNIVIDKFPILKY